MSKIQNIAAELNMWANETEQIYRATKDIKYRKDATHLRYLAATLSQSSLPSSTVTQIIAGSNITISPISGTGAVTINASNVAANGLPVGGTTGQILAKVDNTDYNTEWIDNYTSTLKHEVKAGQAINKGQAVYVSSADGTNMIVSKASNTSEATSSKTMGLLAQNLALNGKGFVITEGLLAGLNTTGANAEGDPVWLGVNGDLIYGLVNKPYAPAHLVFIGIVTRINANNGEIFVKVQNGFELDELHNVDARNPSNNDGIFYNSTTGLWEHKPVSSVYTTPTLAQVTTAGYTTTNPIIAGQYQIYGTTRNARLSSDNVGGFDINYNIGGTPDWRWFGGGTTALTTFKANGNVLIGTTTDNGQKLQVNGTSRLGGNTLVIGSTEDASNTASLTIQTTNTSLRLGGNTTYSWIQSHSSKPLYINELGNNVVLNLGGGNVGIGTATPNTLLHVAKDLGTGGVLVHFNNTNSTTSQNLYFSFNSSKDVTWAQGSASGGTVFDTGTRGHSFQINGVTNIVFNSLGQVGIGTTSPTYKLDVAGNTRVNGGNTSADIPFIINNRFQFRGDGVLQYGNAAGHGRLTWDNSGAYFTGLSGYGVGLGANGVLNHLFINTSGNVGIGTASPIKPLHIQSSDSGWGMLRLYRDNTIQGEVSIGFFGKSNTATNEAWVIGESGWSNLNDFVIGNENGGAGGNVRLLIQRDGKVGIGTTGPSQLLHVQANTASNEGITIQNVNAGGNPQLRFLNAAGVQVAAITHINASVSNVFFYTSSGGNLLNLVGTNVLIGTTTDAGYKLDVNGTLRVQNIPAGATSNGRFLVQASAGGIEYRTAAQMLSDIDVPGYVSSRGENLVTNGTGLRKSNYNFSAFTFVGSDAYYTTGSFRDTVYSSSPTTDEAIPVDVNQRYRLTVSARQNPYVGARYYVGVSLIDADGLPVTASHHMYKANTLTTLAAPLNPGDTVVYLTSAANWENGGTAGVNTHLRSFIFWNYVNSLGYAFPALTYSRNYHGNMWDPGSVNTTTNTITLRVPWPNSTVPAGTQLSNGSSGGTYKYITAANVQIPNAWTTYTGIIEGVDTTGTNVTNKFAPGTAAIKILFLNNRDVAGATVYYTNVQFALDTQNPADQILNQSTPVQTANFSISGTGYIGTRLGIGTSSSSVNLAVLHPTNTIAALIGGGTATPAWVGIGTVNTGALPIIQGYNNAVSASNSIAINPTGGNVIVGGTTDAGYRLDVNGTGRITGNTIVSGRLSVGTTSTAGTGITVSGSSVLLSFVELQNASSLYFYDSGNSTYSTITQQAGHLIINSSASNVGIGIGSPTNKLDVNGTFRASGAVTFSGNNFRASTNEFQGTVTIPNTLDATNNTCYINIGTFSDGFTHIVVEVELVPWLLNTSNIGSYSKTYVIRMTSASPGVVDLYASNVTKDIGPVGDKYQLGTPIANASNLLQIPVKYIGTGSGNQISANIRVTGAVTGNIDKVSLSVGTPSPVSAGTQEYVSFRNRIGIGTTSPISALQVSTAITASSAIARGIYLNQTLVAAANNDVLVGLDIAPTFTNGAFTGVQNTALRVTSSAFEVAQFRRVGNSSARITVTNESGTLSTIMDANSTTGAAFGSATATDVTFVTAQTGRLKVYNSTGNVVIQNGGTFTDAGYRLDVNGTVRFQDNLLFSSNKGIYASSALTTVLQSSTDYFTHNRLSSSGTHGFQIAQLGVTQSFWRWNDSNGNTEFGAGSFYGLQFFTNNASRVTVDVVGNVGIGTTGPSEKLHVIGNILATGNLNVNGVVNATSTYTNCGLLSSINVGTNSTAIISFTAKQDPNNWWNPGTNKWTPTIAGYYYVALQVRWDIGTLGNQINIQILKNTSTQAIAQDLLPTNTGLTQTTNCIVYMNGSTDYLEFSGFTSSTTGEFLFGEASGTWTFFNAFRIN